MSKYNRILLKLSGEALAGSKGMGIDFDRVLEICAEIKEVIEKTNVEVAIVVGGGNFWRGRSNQHMDKMYIRSYWNVRNDNECISTQRCF